MTITKEMLAKCQNETGQVFGMLPKDVQDAMKSAPSGSVQFMHADGIWSDAPLPSFSSGRCYRLRPDTPFEREYVYGDIAPNHNGVVRMKEGIEGLPPYAAKCTLIGAFNLATFAGILYRAADGTETWRTTIDCAFGTPIKVRFVK